MKSCILYIDHIGNETSIKNYGNLYNQVDKNKYDLIGCSPKKYLDDKRVIWFKYKNGKLKHRQFVNPSVVVEDFYKNNSNYKYYYVFEGDVYFNGDLNHLLNEFDTAVDADLLGSYIGNYEDKAEGYFYGLLRNLGLLRYVLKCKKSDCVNGCMSFSRLSNKALKKICSYSNLRGMLIYEMYGPTICKKEGLKVLSLNKQSTSKDYLSDYNLMDKTTFHYKNSSNSNDKLKKNMFYTEFIGV